MTDTIGLLFYAFKFFFIVDHSMSAGAALDISPPAGQQWEQHDKHYLSFPVVLLCTLQHPHSTPS